MMKLAIAACATVLMAGCATTSGSAPTESRSGFDGARVVNIAGHGAACRQALCPGLGAQWNSRAPDTAILTVYLFNEFRGITGAELSIDGQQVELHPTQALTNFSRPGDAVRESRLDFAVPMTVVRSITSAQKAWLRVRTTDGYVEDAIIDGPTDSKAFHALKRFLAAVDAR